MSTAPVRAQSLTVRAGISNPISSTIVVKAKPSANVQGFLTAANIALRWPASANATILVTSSPYSIARQDSGTDGIYKWVSLGFVSAGESVTWTANTEYELFNADVIGLTSSAVVELTTSPAGKADWYLEAGDNLAGLANRADAGTPFYAQSVTVFPPFTRISSFTGRYEQTTGHVILNWETASEINNKGFEVQKSLDQFSNFATIPNSFVQGHGSTTQPFAYSFTELTPTPGPWYYRLRQIDLDETDRFNDPIIPDGLASVPFTPVLISPGNKTTGHPIQLLPFTWSHANLATRYHLQLGTDSTFATGLVKNDTSITDTFRLISGLTIATRYYWRVRGGNDSGVGPFSQTWSFTSLIPLPGTISLQTPANRTTVGQDSIRFSWTQTTPAALRYWIEVSPDSTFGPFTFIDSTLSDTTLLFKPLVNNRTYFWRVRGGNDGGWGPLTEVRRFSVIITGVEEEEGLPKDYALRQNYPNPFNPATTIGFALPAHAHVTLKVYNALGEEVAALVDEEMEAGRSSIQFNAAGLPSGVYFYRLQAGNFIESKKMLLVK